MITGGESGPKARPSHPNWFRGLRNQCQAAGVPFFFKQWGEYKTYAHGLSPTEITAKNAVDLPGGLVAVRVGKKAAGRLLDGRTWDEFPEVNHA